MKVIKLPNYEPAILYTKDKHVEDDITITLEDDLIPKGTLDIIDNGEYDVTKYAKANINVTGGEDVTEETDKYTKLNGELKTVINSLPDISEGSEECNGLPLEVNELPAVGVEGTFYKLVKTEEVNQLWMHMPGQGSVNLSGDNSMGIKYSVEIVEDYPDNPIPSTDYQTLYLYYIPAMNNLYLFNTQEWTTLGELLGGEFAIYVVGSPDEFTEQGMYIVSSTKVSTTQYLFENDKYIVVGDDNYRAIADTIVFPDKPCEIVIPETWNIVPYQMFSYVTGLTEVTIHKNVTSIEMYAFQGCKNMKKVTFEENSQLTSIDAYAFDECNSLSNIEIPNGITSIERETFRKCGLTNIIIPNNVVSIKYRAFYGCGLLEEIVIPNSVTNIEEDAFTQCSRLKSVTIPDSITTINKSTFWGCDSLSNVEIPNSVTSIEKLAFYNTGLASIVIPNSVTSIRESAFANCIKLATVTLQSTTPPTLHITSFEGCTALTEIRVPMSAVEAYKSATNWSEYADIIVGYE